MKAESAPVVIGAVLSVKRPLVSGTLVATI